MPYQFPFIAEYKNGNKSLHYVATKHAASVKHETFKLVKKEITEFKPEVVIIEGFPKKGGFSNKRYLEYVKKQVTEQTYPGESSYAAILSNREGIPFIGAEPTDVEVKDYIEKKGFSEIDMLAYNITRMIPEYALTKQNSKFDFKAFYKDQYTFSKKSYAISKDLNFLPEDYIKWYENKNHEKFDLQKITTSTVAPLMGNNALFTQKISYYEDEIRNKIICQTISEMLQRYNKVLIVYGGGHLVQQRKIIEHMIGKPNRYFKLQGNKTSALK